MNWFNMQVCEILGCDHSTGDEGMVANEFHDGNVGNIVPRLYLMITVGT